MPTLDSLSISIPAYNDAATIARVVEDSLKVAAEVTQDYEVLAIDDGSRDETGAILDSLARGNPRIRVRHHEKNEGFGTTLREVFTLPEKSWVFFIPGDGQIPPGELLKLVQGISGFDFILGKRVAREDSARRRLNSAVYNAAVSLVGLRRVTDVNSVVLFRRKVLDGIDLTSRSAFIHAEIFLKLAGKGVSIGEVPIAHRKREHGRPAGGRPGVILACARELVGYILAG